jgi:predicted Zn finger-like uncharacterized protein
MTLEVLSLDHGLRQSSGLEKGQRRAHSPGMVQVWKSGSGEDFTCPHCGAVYAVTINRLPAKDSDDVNCLERGKITASRT